MAIITDYDFHGIPIPGAYINVGKIVGSSKEGWHAQIIVYVVKVVPHEATDTEPAWDEEVRTAIDSFNVFVPFSDSERGYASVYAKLKGMYPEASDA